MHHATWTVSFYVVAITCSPCVLDAYAVDAGLVKTSTATPTATHGHEAVPYEVSSVGDRLGESLERPVLGQHEDAVLVVAPVSPQVETLSANSRPLPVGLWGEASSAINEIADVPKPITSFGAAIIGDQVYAYGGHFGNAHEYSTEGQSDELIQLNLKKPGRWKVLSRGPKLQGLAMVTDGEKLYRLGGFTAKNQPGDDHDLWSQAQVASFDLESKQWSELPNLPEPRSSFDAVMLDNVIYVVGGWQMAGEAETRWHETAWSLDLSSNPLVWKPLAKPPFQRRAVGAAAYGGKVYVIGGMQNRGGPTTKVAIYDPEKDIWSAGPSIPGEGMEGFGTAAFAQGGRLFVSTYGGHLLRLSEDGKTWEKSQKLATARFFHRMLPVGKQQMIFFGGANMEIGKFDHVDLIEVR